ncbi:MAG: CpsD/CapB family tyrosine-protein kinase [Leptolyngbyaceae cyanobacterium SL_1_1]|nr:CpsD/CapB family tyrosine-protein kinase [Leptolyngbyaceae cyanobacterium SL_1_1]
MDGVVLVVSLDKTHSPALMQTLERLKLSRIPILGTVINGVKRSAMPSYDYYYHQRHSLSEEPVVLNGAVHNGNGASPMVGIFSSLFYKRLGPLLQRFKLRER